MHPSASTSTRTHLNAPQKSSLQRETVHQELPYLKDFLDTLDRLQVDFQQRLGGIEPTVLRRQTEQTSSVQEVEDFTQPCEGAGCEHQLGVKAVWNVRDESLFV
ncbi:hypothetical protein ACIPWY_11725 [Streptomyces sp. NPDC090032]|uniref:hypothetical protein n=1 Tax=unclassified Streptomyces TaxID=2593676 RepID=UPI00372345F4